MSKRKAKEMKVTAAPAKKRKRVKAAAAECVVATSAPLVLNAVTTAEREERNGIKRPKDGGKCAEVWSALDAIHAAGTTPATKDVKDLAVARSWNINNATAELSAWRKFMGLSKPQPGKHGPRRKSAAKEAALPRMSAEEVIPLTA